ncbi:MAG: response regulator [Anaerolineales bacterium]|jgi:two-component system cell cycle response regulator DivK
MTKILIVEDVELNYDLLVQLLEDDYELIGARDGQEGVQLAAAEHPDLILMDMSLPVMNGWSATEAIKSDPGLTLIPVIGLSAHALLEEKAKALNSGCDAYLTKPVDEVALFQTIERLLKRAQRI